VGWNYTLEGMDGGSFEMEGEGMVRSAMRSGG
jgi:hypothetical protein